MLTYLHRNTVWQVFPANQEDQGIQAFLDQPVPPVQLDSAVIQVLRDYLADLALRDFLAVQAGQDLLDGQALPVCYLCSLCFYYIFLLFSVLFSDYSVPHR